MPFFLFLFCNQKKRKERRRKKKKNMQMFSTPSLCSVVFFLFASQNLLCSLLSLRDTLARVNIKPCARRRVRSTVASIRVPVYRQQPFNPMPEGYWELLRVFLSSFWGRIFLLFTFIFQSYSLSAKLFYLPLLRK